MFLEGELLRCVLQRYLSRAARREGPQCSQSLARAGEAGAWPSPRGWEVSCEFHRDCPRCAHWSVCLFHVCFFQHGNAPPDRRDASHGRGPCNTASCQGESSSFCNQGGGLSSFAFPPRFPSTFFFFASDPSSMTS